MSPLYSRVQIRTHYHPKWFYLFFLCYEQTSTWRGLHKKLKIIGPMVWPKNNLWLQFCVVLCGGILVAGRVTNLYVPIYYKYIGELSYQWVGVHNCSTNGASWDWTVFKWLLVQIFGVVSLSDILLVALLVLAL